MAHPNQLRKSSLVPFLLPAGCPQEAGASSNSPTEKIVQPRSKGVDQGSNSLLIPWPFECPNFAGCHHSCEIARESCKLGGFTCVECSGKLCRRVAASSSVPAATAALSHASLLPEMRALPTGVVGKTASASFGLSRCARWIPNLMRANSQQTPPAPNSSQCSETRAVWVMVSSARPDASVEKHTSIQLKTSPNSHVNAQCYYRPHVVITSAALLCN